MNWYEFTDIWWKILCAEIDRVQWAELMYLVEKSGRTLDIWPTPALKARLLACSRAWSLEVGAGCSQTLALSFPPWHSARLMMQNDWARGVDKRMLLTPPHKCCIITRLLARLGGICCVRFVRSCIRLKVGKQVMRRLCTALTVTLSLNRATWFHTTTLS